MYSAMFKSSLSEFMMDKLANSSEKTNIQCIVNFDGNNNPFGVRRFLKQ